MYTGVIVVMPILAISTKSLCWTPSSISTNQQYTWTSCQSITNTPFTLSFTPCLTHNVSDSVLCCINKWKHKKTNHYSSHNGLPAFIYLDLFLVFPAEYHQMSCFPNMLRAVLLLVLVPWAAWEWNRHTRRRWHIYSPQDREGGGGET